MLSATNFMRVVTLIVVGVCISCTSTPWNHSKTHEMTSHPEATEALDLPWASTNGTVNISAWDFGANTYYFQTTRAILNGTPRWSENADFPPLPPLKAEAAARVEAERLCPEVQNWVLDYIKLCHLSGECWCWKVCLGRGDVVVMGQPILPIELEIPVLMNGQAVHGSQTFTD